jgi:hypothetical protein
MSTVLVGRTELVNMPEDGLNSMGSRKPTSGLGVLRDLAGKSRVS